MPSGCDAKKTKLISVSACVQVAAAYLAWCPVHGRAALESLLGMLPLQASDPALAAKSVAVCRRHGLDRLAEGGYCGGWYCGARGGYCR